MTPTRVDIAWKLTCQTTGCAGKPSTDCTILTGPNKGKPRKGLGLHAGRLLAGDEALGIWASRQGEIDTLTTQAAGLAEQLKTARIGAALVPGLQDRIKELTTASSNLTALLAEEQADNDTLTATIADLRAQIAALTKPPVVVTEPKHPVTADAVIATAGTAKAALAKVPTGGTLVLRGGVYPESLGNLTRAITIQAYPGETVWFDGQGTLATAIITSAKINLFDLGIRNYAPTSINNGSNASVYFGGVSAGSVVDGCTFTNSKMASLAFQVADLTIRNTSFSNNGFSGVMGGYDSPTARLDRFVFEDNVVSGMNRDNHPAEPTTAGIKITRATDAVIRGNKISDVAGAYGLWFDVSCLNPLVENNTIDGAAVGGRAAMKHCAELELSEGGTVRGNTFTGASAAGLKVYNTGHVRVEGNKMRGGNCGLWLAQDARRNGGTAKGNLLPSDVPWVTRGTAVIGNDLDTLWAYADDRSLGAVDMVASLQDNKFTAATIRWGRAGTTDQALTVAAAQATLK